MTLTALQGISQTPVVLGSHEVSDRKTAVDTAAKMGATAALTAASTAAATAIATKKKEEGHGVEQLQAAAKQLNDFMKHFATKLDFSVDDSTKTVVVKVLNDQTGEVIRQIPSEEALKAAKALDALQGVIIKTTG